MPLDTTITRLIMMLFQQVKAEAAFEIMVGLKEASNDVRKAADQLVKATKKPSLS